ncbi:MAG TPA: hypothetical protein VFM88_17905 [Vicinamibacteria bacterium]|nr:hypothetical protein [Vicinamibacteria bacterium]
MNSLHVGRTFLSPTVDVLLIGGGLSLFFTVAVVATGGSTSPITAAIAPVFPLVLFLVNMTHFSASTVRLYAKPNAFADFPFLTMGLPLLTLALLSLAVRFAEVVGVHVMNLYLTWSPYHYAAQAYGLALLYCYRSGVTVGDRDRVLFRVACLAPFLYAFVKGPTAGLEWFVSKAWLGAEPWATLRAGAEWLLGGAALALPPALLARSLFRGRALPLISVLVMVSNAAWWTLFFYYEAFGWATVFHGLQYLAIVMIVHVKDRAQAAGGQHGAAYHALTFYAACVALAYLLFRAWPFAFVAAGFGLAESMLLVTAVINIHHFVVDAYIWRLRRDPGYREVAAAPAAA